MDNGLAVKELSLPPVIRSLPKIMGNQNFCIFSLYQAWQPKGRRFLLKQIKISSFLHRIQTHERVHSKSRAKKDDAHYQADSYQIIRLHGFTMLDFAKINISTNKAKL